MTTRTRAVARVGILAIAMSTTLAGCEWSGLNSLPLPGTQGRGENAYQVQIEMPNVTTLSQNSPVLVDDVTVGSVESIVVQNWHALVTVSLNENVELPENVSAKIGQTSLLGSQHLALVPPTDPEGRLQNGDTIPLERAGAYPTTEQTLSSLSVVLNGGGLAQLQDITTELNNAVGGREDSIRDLLPRLDELVSSLDDQRGDIIAAMEGIDRLSVNVENQSATLTKALNELPPALDVLIAQRPDITNAFTSLGRLSDVVSRLVENSGADLKTNIASLTPVLNALANSGNALTDVLSVLLTYPFPQEGINNVIRGDYANLGMTIDLSLPRLDANFLTGTPLAGRMGGLEGALGRQAAPTAAAAGDPLRGPVATPVPPAPAPPALEIPGLPPIPLPTIPGFGVPAP
ncbi:MCE family protein [Rhodococcus sp. PAMC28707]|uniref:MCE family protein n=1 Tax=unclassified Rhodococcus (in: high G+C Gram-positive bacteria) TaxID=192944 RepID=UPI00109E11DB|nr:MULTISPECIES: MCE family protein [unclassified Rhodococcus (in: high G+C Gram-positive bacteria)]QCB50004.1 MCE family protein [Rhodococcus sp. PAMC28705]QCB58301.1 MCE family protein [Rhodococcus sp. PAMC28707]